jgi:hypothetical protein
MYHLRIMMPMLIEEYVMVMIGWVVYIGDIKVSPHKSFDVVKTIVEDIYSGHL